MTTIRPTAREPVRPMTGRNPLPQSLREYRLRRKSVKAAQSDAGSIQVAVPDFSLRAIQGMRVSRQPVFEVLDMRKIDEAFSDSLKTPCNVIPIQDVLLVSLISCNVTVGRRDEAYP